jgi:hypothetical protein
MQQRRRFKQKQSFEDRLASYAKTAREVAALLPLGAEKDELLRKARQADTAAHINAWANSLGLRPPTLPNDLAAAHSDDGANGLDGDPRRLHDLRAHRGVGPRQLGLAKGRAS